jgi:hypothetical protein
VQVDAELAELEQLLDLLLGAAVRWSQRRELDEDVVARIRGTAILRNHRRYVARIPEYRRLAADRGLVDVDDVRVIADELMVTTDLFKSYDGSWLESGDFERMTDWLGGIFVRRPRAALDGVADIGDWRKRLGGDGVYLTYSSGTSGRLSFVPRDWFTWNALRQSGAYYADATGPARPRPGTYDCLVLGPRGNGLGIQAAAHGLARPARRSHYLFDAELGADIVRDGGAARRFGDAVLAKTDASYAAAFAFLRATVEEGWPVLVFGAPFQVSDACARVLAADERLALPPGSVVVTGGGWKAARSERLERAELLELIERTLGIGRSDVVDTYSTSECNCIFPSCAEGRYHIPPLVEPVMLDDRYVSVPGRDVEGILGFLDPFAASYPGFIITGDLARLVHGRCGCGLEGWSIVGEIERAPTSEAKGCAGVLASVTA